MRSVRDIFHDKVVRQLVGNLGGGESCVLRQDLLGNDPQNDQVPRCVVTNVVESGRGLVQPVQHRLADCHDTCRKSKQNGKRSRSAGNPPAFRFVDPRCAAIPYGEVGEIEDALDDIHPGLRRREAVAQVPLLKAVHVIDAAVEIVRNPEGRVGPPAGHRGGTAKDVAHVPGDEGKRDGHPHKREGCGRVRPSFCSSGGAFPGAGGGVHIEPRCEGLGSGTRADHRDSLACCGADGNLLGRPGPQSASGVGAPGELQ